MATIDWPRSLRYFAADVPVLEGGYVSAGPSLTGQERGIATDAGRWRYGARIRLNTRDRIVAWRALLAKSRYRANRIRVPILDWMHGPAAVAGVIGLSNAGAIAAGVPHSDGAYFNDGSGYALDYSTASVAVSAVAQATSIRLTMSAGLRPDPGQFFSDGDWLYQIETATLVTGTAYDVSFVPPLRQAIAAGRQVSFERLFCTMRFANNDVMRAVQETDLSAEASVSFVEALV